jgi:glyoxylase-like metal-dependent hydrolase (beta-lactamase superfamily II)
MECHLDVLDLDIPPSPEVAWPTLTVSDSITLHWGEETVRVVHLPPAHSDGDLMVHFVESDVVHVGDLYFNFGYPYVDTAQGGTVNGVIKALEDVLVFCGEKTQIVPGHGPVADREDLTAYVNTLREFRDIVAAEREAGKSLQTILEERPTRALDERYGQAMFSPEMFTRMVWASLGGE